MLLEKYRFSGIIVSALRRISSLAEGSTITLPDVELTVLPDNLRLPVSTNAGNIFVVPVASLNVIFAASCDVLVDWNCTLPVA